MGKGMCFNLIAQTAECARAILGFVCCVLCAGPILFIIGIVVLATPNHRNEDVRKYNAAVKTWDSSESGPMKASTFEIGDTEMTQMISPVVIQGDTEDVDMNATSIYFQGYVPSPLSNGMLPIPITITYEGVTRFITVTAPIIVSITSPLKCSRSYCDGMGAFDCPSGYRIRYEGKSHCERDETCGTCYGTGYLSRACFVVRRSGNDWTEDTKVGCKYPFTESQHDSSFFVSNTIGVVVRSVYDPFLALEDITEGKDNFGRTFGQQVSAGIVMLVLGIVIMCLLFGVIFLLMCHKGSRSAGNQYWDRVVGRPVELPPPPPAPQEMMGISTYYPQQPPPPRYQVPIAPMMTSPRNP
jgi:hypothetical protein